MTAPPDMTKACPDCAESVLAEANVCKHCGYRFAAATTTGGKSAGVAALLSLVLAGLGQLYLGERGRGALYLFATVLAVAGGIATETVGPAPIIGIIAAFDAYRSGRDRIVRQPSVTLGLLVIVIGVAVGVGISKHDREAETTVDGLTNTQWRLQQYDRCVAEAALEIEQCGRIYGAP